MNNFKIEIASVPDREKVVAEIWFGESLIAELNQENDELGIQLYSSKTAFDFNDFLNALNVAKKNLLE
jgi:hypothetical protein